MLAKGPSCVVVAAASRAGSRKSRLERDHFYTTTRSMDWARMGALAPRRRRTAAPAAVAPVAASRARSSCLSSNPPDAVAAALTTARSAQRGGAAGALERCSRSALGEASEPGRLEPKAAAMAPSYARVQVEDEDGVGCASSQPSAAGTFHSYLRDSSPPIASWCSCIICAGALVVAHRRWPPAGVSWCSRGRRRFSSRAPK